jgi:FtsP/CotA-like multicopper oxidase with cupredoxin domain
MESEMKPSLKLAVVLLGGLLACRGPGPAPNDPDIYLDAQVFQIPANTFNNSDPITMWGFARCAPGFASCGSPSAPGPELSAAEGSTLSLHVRNSLSGPYVEPVSIVIPGQITSMTPVWVDARNTSVTSTSARAPGDYQSRVRSFTSETAPGSVSVYTWSNLKAGTYLYQSGTHPAVQIQMGFYGTLKVYGNAPNRAYDDGSSRFDSEVTLLFSEIDPVLHGAIQTGNYGPNPNAPNLPPTGWLTSTIDYHPKFFLINGRPYTPGAPPLPGGNGGGRLLLRFLNAGLQTKVPTVQGRRHMSVIAEDGNFITVTRPSGETSTAPRQQYSVLLPAAKTVDAILVSSGEGEGERDIPVYDRRLNLTNAGTFPGGQLTYLAMRSEGGEQTLEAEPQTLNFASSSREGSTRAASSVRHDETLTVTLKNNGLAARVITGASITPNPSDFSVSWSGPVVLAGGSQTTVVVTAHPWARAAAYAHLQLTTNDPNQPLLTVNLRLAP